MNNVMGNGELISQNLQNEDLFDGLVVTTQDRVEIVMNRSSGCGGGGSGGGGGCSGGCCGCRK